jgi:integrase
MGTSTRRLTLAPGIYDVGTSLRGKVSVGSPPHRRIREQAFPRGTPLETIARWQDQTRRLLGAGLEVAPGPVGSLAADAITYLATVTTMPSYVARRADLEAWLPRFGHRSRHTLQTVELTAQINDWAGQGVAASTINHRRQALRALYACFDPGGAPPIDHTERQAPPPLQARALTWPDTLELLAALPEGKAATMLRVMAQTGFPPVRITRLKPEHVNERDRTVFIEGRRKGQGTKSKTLPITDDALEALRAHFAHFPRGGSVAKTSWIVVFHRAVGRVNTQRAAEGRPPLPQTANLGDGVAPLRPYDLRHTFGTELYRRTGDLKAVAAMLDVSLETAERYTLGAVDGQMLKARDVMNQAPEGSMVAQKRVWWRAPPSPIAPRRKVAETGVNLQSGKSAPPSPRLVPGTRKAAKNV